MTLTKAKLVKSLSEIGFDESSALHLVESFFKEIKLSLEQGHHVRLSGFGNFMLRDKKERPGRNPKTGEGVTITPRRVVTFKAGRKLKTRIERCDPTNSISKDDSGVGGYSKDLKK